MAYLGVAHTRAQTPAAKPKIKPAFVRFWNMLPDLKQPDLQLYIAAGQRMTTNWAGDTNVSYTPVLPGTYTFFVRRVGEENKDVKTPPVQLLENSFVTLLATLKDGRIGVEVLNETIDPAKDDGLAHLTVRQFCSGTQVRVTVGATPPKALSYGEVTVFDSLPTTQVPVIIQATLPNGTSRTINTGADFTKNHYATLLMVNDGYGRFRPAFAFDGHSDLNLASVQEHWVQAYPNSPILLPPHLPTRDEVLPVGSADHPKKKRRKSKTKHHHHATQAAGTSAPESSATPSNEHPSGNSDSR